jgi:hypothetical protein
VKKLPLESGAEAIINLIRFCKLFFKIIELNFNFINNKKKFFTIFCYNYKFFILEE